MAPPPPSILTGIVISAGKMQRAVTVKVARQVYNSFLQKHFQRHKNFLVSDPNDSLRTGDIVQIEGAGRTISRRIKHVVSHIIAPWGPPLEERPPIFTRQERDKILRDKTLAKRARRAEKKRLTDYVAHGVNEETVISDTSKDAAASMEAA